MYSSDSSLSFGSVRDSESLCMCGETRLLRGECFLDIQDFLDPFDLLLSVMNEIATSHLFGTHQCTPTEFQGFVDSLKN